MSNDARPLSVAPSSTRDRASGSLSDVEGVGGDAGGEAGLDCAGGGAVGLAVGLGLEAGEELGGKPVPREVPEYFGSELGTEVVDALAHDVQRGRSRDQMAFGVGGH